MAAKSEETKQKILEAALSMFRDRGFEESTIREIAKQAGVATGLAYYYFPKKERSGDGLLCEGECRNASAGGSCA